MEFDSMEKKVNRMFKIVFLLWILMALLGLALTSGLVYVVYKVLVHFSIL